MPNASHNTKSTNIFELSSLRLPIITTLIGLTAGCSGLQRTGESSLELQPNPLIQPDRVEMDAETFLRAMRTVHLSRELIRSGNGLAPLNELDQHTKTAVLTLTRDWMEAEQAPAGNPHAVETWQVFAQVTLQLSPIEGSVRIAQAETHLNDHLQSFLSDENPSLESLERQARDTYRILSSCTETGRERCLDHLDAIESTLLNLEDGELKEFVSRMTRELSERGSSLRERAEVLTVSDPALSGLSENRRNQLQSLQDLLKTGEGFSHTPDGYRFTTEKGEAWSVGFLNVGDDFLVVFHHQGVSQLPHILERDEFTRLSEDGALSSRLDEALTLHALERENEAALRSYDLPRDRTTTHIRLFDAEYDRVVSYWLQSSALLCRTLEGQYGERYQSLPASFSQNVKETLRTEIRETLAEDPSASHFLLDLYDHGARGRIAFPGGLDAQDLADLAEEFPQCTFDVMTVACYGGGLRPEFQRLCEEKPELAARINLFIHTRPTEVNLVPAGKFEPELNSSFRGSPYHYFFMEALLQGKAKSFGAAAEYADEKSKGAVPVDAESLINGTLITANDREFESELQAA